MEIDTLLKSKKHVFWQAFFLTVFFFLLGFVFGIYIEQLRTDNVNIAFYNSEVSLYDSFALTEHIIQDSSVSCESVKEVIINFADKIYEEARELEKFDDSNELTESVKIVHRKYDLLRTLLWMNIIDFKKDCEVNTVIYLYVYDTQEIELKAKQLVWNRILWELKNKERNEFILIPIAVDQDITSLDYLVKKYGVREFPAVIINEVDILYEHQTAESLSSNYLK